jgi:hypothetical protein
MAYEEGVPRLRGDEAKHWWDSSPCYECAPLRGAEPYNVPSARIQYRSIPGDTGETCGGHWCGSTYELDFNYVGALYITKCAILPPQSAAAQVERLGVSGR